jgi:UDP-N-acetylmuramate dehydrogenase
MSLINEIQQISDLTLELNQDLTSYTTMRLASRGDVIEVHSIPALQRLLPLLSQHNRKYLMVGWGANQILPPVCDDMIIHLNFPFDQSYFETQKDEYHLPASVGLNYLTAHAVKFGLKGWEVFTGIPASLGGAIYMNAGTNLGEIGKLVKKVSLVDAQGNFREEIISDKSFSYRHNHFVKNGDVIVGAVICHDGIDLAISQKIKDYLEYRKKTQPLATKNCGCVFKNPQKELQAGRLIDLMGLKGLTVGGLRISPKHANFIENTGTSNWDQFEFLVNIVKSNVDIFYGIEFELEVKIPYH